MQHLILYFQVDDTRARSGFTQEWAEPNRQCRHKTGLVKRSTGKHVLHCYERAGRAFHFFNSPYDFGPGANEYACENALTFFAEKLGQTHIPRSFATLSLEHGYGDPPRRLLKIRTRWVRQF